MLQRVFPVLLLISLFSAPVFAQEASCLAAGVRDMDCRDPVEGEWHSWRFVLGETPGPVRDNEADALNDAVAQLEHTFFCGLTYSPEPSPYVATKRQWAWTTQEEAIRIQYIGLLDEDRKACTGKLVERSGMVLIRRERKIRCPRDYNWLVRDEQHAVCVRE